MKVCVEVLQLQATKSKTDSQTGLLDQINLNGDHLEKIKNLDD